MMKTLYFLVFLTSAVRAATFKEGIEFKKSGRHAAAAEIFAQLVAKTPDDADSLEQLATLQGWLGKYDDSISTWRKALALYPDSADYHLGLARVLYWKGEPERSLREVDFSLAAQPGNPDALKLKGDVRRAMRRPLRWRLDAGFIYDNYYNFRHHERGSYAQIGYNFADTGGLWLRHDWMNHFRKVDNTFAAGGHWRPRREALLTAGAGITPSPDFRSRTQFDAAIEIPAFRTFTPLFSYRYLRYDRPVHIMTPGLRLQFVPWMDHEFTYGVTKNTDDSTTVAYRIRFAWYLGDVLIPYFSYTHGREALPPLVPATVSYYTGGIAWNVTRAFGLRFDLSQEMRKNFYKHNSLASGMTLKF